MKIRIFSNAFASELPLSKFQSKLIPLHNPLIAAQVIFVEVFPVK